MGERNKKGALEGDGLERLIFRLRGCREMLDVDLARLYGVSTGRFITARELVDLRSQFAISSLQPAE